MVPPVVLTRLTLVGRILAKGFIFDASSFSFSLSFRSSYESTRLPFLFPKLYVKKRANISNYSRFSFIYFVHVFFYILYCNFLIAF
jgi:hypothetical protein